MEYEIVGHGFFGETWGIEKGIVMGRPDDDATWNKLDEVVFDRVMRFENGVGLRVSMSFVDEGGHFTQSVRAQCNARISKKVFCIKGMPGQDKPYILAAEKAEDLRQSDRCRHLLAISARRRFRKGNHHG